MGVSNDFLKIGEIIKGLREEKGLTQAELAKRIRVKRETVNQWENNVRDLKTQYTISLAKEFGVSADYILGITPGVKTTDIKTKEICNYTGLSEKALESIISLQKHQLYFPCLIRLLESHYLQGIVLFLSDFIYDRQSDNKRTIKERKEIKEYIAKCLSNDSEYDFESDIEYLRMVLSERQREEFADFQKWKLYENITAIIDEFIEEHIPEPEELKVPMYDFLKGLASNCFPSDKTENAENLLHKCISYNIQNENDKQNRGVINGKYNKEE